MMERSLKPKELEALRIIRNYLVHQGRAPSIRELMTDMGDRYPRSAAFVIEKLVAAGFVRRTAQGLQILKDAPSMSENVRTVAVPLVGTVACGAPLLAEENTECMLPVAASLAKPGSRYFLLRAKGDSMNLAGIDEGDLLLIRQQNTAEAGDRIVALIDDEATVKELQTSRGTVVLKPRSSNSRHKPILLDREFQIQGVVVEVFKGAADLLE